MNRGYKGTLIVTACSLGLNFLAVMIQFRYLGAESRGIIAAINNLPTLAFIVGSFGFTNSAAYFSGKNPQNSGGIVSTLSLILFLWSIPFTAVLYLLLPILLRSQSPHTAHLAAIFLLSIPLQFLNNVPQAALQGIGRLGIWNFLRLLAPLALFIVMIVAFCLPGDPLANLVRIQLITIAILVCVTWGIVFVTFPRPFKSALPQLPEILRYGIPSGLTTLPAQLNLRADQVLMAAFVSATVLGVYSFSVAWASLVGTIFAAMGQVLFPRLVAEDLQSNQHRSIYESVQRALGIGLLVALGLSVTSYWILPVIFGEKFRTNYPAVLILIVANIFAGLNQLFGDSFRGMGETKPPLWAEGSGFIVTLLLLYPLVRHFGAYGAASVSLLAYATTTTVLLSFLVSRHHLNLGELLRPKLLLRRSP